MMTAKPLELDELIKLDGNPVWCVDGEGHTCYCLVNAMSEECVDNECGVWTFEFYGMFDAFENRLHRLGWMAYRTKPDEKGE